MKKIANLTLLLAIIVTIAAGCSFNGSPSDTVKAAYDKLMKKDFDGVLDLYDNDGKELTKDEREAAKNMLVFAFNNVEKEFNGIEKVEVTKETISDDGKTATVDCLIVYGNGKSDTSTERLVRKDNRWYLTR